MLRLGLVAALFFSISAFGAIVTGSSRDVTGSIYAGPLNQLQFKPLASPQGIGTNVYWPVNVYAKCTNGYFGVSLIAGWYYVSIVTTDPLSTPARKLIFAPESTNTYTFTDCADLARQFPLLYTNIPPALNGYTGTNVIFYGQFFDTNGAPIGTGGGVTNGGGVLSGYLTNATFSAAGTNSVQAIVGRMGVVTNGDNPSLEYLVLVNPEYGHNLTIEADRNSGHTGIIITNAGTGVYSEMSWYGYAGNGGGLYNVNAATLQGWTTNQIVAAASGSTTGALTTNMAQTLYLDTNALAAANRWGIKDLKYRGWLVGLVNELKGRNRWASTNTTFVDAWLFPACWNPSSRTSLMGNAYTVSNAIQTSFGLTFTNALSAQGANLATSTNGLSTALLPVNLAKSNTIVIVWRFDSTNIDEAPLGSAKEGTWYPSIFFALNTNNNDAEVFIGSPGFRGIYTSSAGVWNPNAKNDGNFGIASGSNLYTNSYKYQNHGGLINNKALPPHRMVETISTDGSGKYLVWVNGNRAAFYNASAAFDSYTNTFSTTIPTNGFNLITLGRDLLNQSGWNGFNAAFECEAVYAFNGGFDANMGLDTWAISSWAIDSEDAVAIDGDSIMDNSTTYQATYKNQLAAQFAWRYLKSKKPEPLPIVRASGGANWTSISNAVFGQLGNDALTALPSKFTKKTILTDLGNNAVSANLAGAAYWVNTADVSWWRTNWASYVSNYYYGTWTNGWSVNMVDGYIHSVASTASYGPYAAWTNLVLAQDNIKASVPWIKHIPLVDYVNEQTFTAFSADGDHMTASSNAPFMSAMVGLCNGSPWPVMKFQKDFSITLYKDSNGLPNTNNTATLYPNVTFDGTNLTGNIVASSGGGGSTSAGTSIAYAGQSWGDVAVTTAGIGFFPNGNYKGAAINNYTGTPIPAGTYTNLVLQWAYPGLAASTNVTLQLWVNTNGTILATPLQLTLQGSMTADNSWRMTNSGTASAVIPVNGIAVLKFTSSSNTTPTAYFSWSMERINK